MIRGKAGILGILLFLIFLPSPSSEGFVQLGQLPSPGPLVLPSDTANDTHASGMAIIATVETAAAMMQQGADQGRALEDLDALGIIEPVSVPDNIQGMFLSGISIDADWTSLGGYLTSKHCAIMDNQGRRHVFARGGDNALWDNVDGSWVYIGGSLSSAPYAAKDKSGRIHIVARGADLALWDFVFDTATWSGTWRGLGGALSSLATAAIEPTYGNYMKIMVRGADSSLWLCEFLVTNLSTYTWIGFGGSLNTWPFIMFDANSRLHTFAAGGDYALWDNRGVLSGGAYTHNWHSLGGGINAAPFATLEPGYTGYVAGLVRGADNALWLADIYVLGDPETCNWLSLGGYIASETFASTDTFNRIHTFVRGSDAAMCENVFSSSPWNPAGNRWIGHGGSIGWSPQALLDGQTYAYVLGTNAAIWRTVYTTSAPSSSVWEESEKVDRPVDSEGLVPGGTGASMPLK